MKNYFKFAGIPLGIFVVLFVIPRLFATLINAHSDIGIAAVVTIICMIFSVVVVYVNDLIKKANEDER